MCWNVWSLTKHACTNLIIFSSLLWSRSNRLKTHFFLIFFLVKSKYYSSIFFKKNLSLIFFLLEIFLFSSVRNFFLKFAGNNIFNARFANKLHEMEGFFPIITLSKWLFPLWGPVGIVFILFVVKFRGKCDLPNCYYLISILGLNKTQTSISMGPTSCWAVLRSKLVDGRCQIQSSVTLVVLAVSKFSVIFSETRVNTG